MTMLIHPDGSENRIAIEAEIRRRCDAQEQERGWFNRPYHERHVLSEAAGQQWDLIQAEIGKEWSKGERRVYEEALSAASIQSIDARGNDRYDELLRKARLIQEVVTARAVRKFHQRIGQ